jgi:hypothetical protein
MYKPNLGVIEKDFGTEEVSLADINYVSLNSLARARDFRLRSIQIVRTQHQSGIWNIPVNPLRSTNSYVPVYYDYRTVLKREEQK